MRTQIKDPQAKESISELTRFFSSTIIKELASRGKSTLAGEILTEIHMANSFTPTMRLRDFYDAIFDLLFRNYRNEYIYKNALANKVLLGTHSLNTSFMLTELRAANCKADVVLLNGTSTVYEIKSKYDKMSRLKKQVSAYKTIFDHVNVITSEDQLENVLEEVEESVGIMLLHDRNCIKTLRNPQSMKKQVVPEMIFDTLRQSEYQAVIESKFGFVPDVPNMHMYRECKALFCQLNPEDAHDYMVQHLKRRGKCLALREFITDVPESLKAVSLSCKLSKKEQAFFLNILDESIGSIFSLRTQS
jgi:hypothetical protein